MANEFHNPHQKGIIKRYYEHIDTISAQKLGDLVGDLYLETNPAKKHAMWMSAKTALTNMKVDPKRVDKVIGKCDLEGLAKLLEELF